MSTSFNPPDLSRYHRTALIVGVAFLVILIVWGVFNHQGFHQAYLLGFTFWAGIALGSLALLMLQHLTGGGWGFVIRRTLEASTRTLPLIAVLFVPILLGAHALYPWTHQEEIDKHPVIQAKIAYLDLQFFSIRAVVYFAVWLTLAFLLNRWSLQQDRTADQQSSKQMRVLSGPGMVLFIFTVTFASVDWYMSLEPEFTSTIYGFIYVASWSVSALAFVIAVVATLSKQEPLKGIVAPLHFHDLGKLLLALVMLWAYFAFSQYLIIWSGNLPEEIGWYLHRTRGTWGVIALTIITLHFAAPFLFLLSRSLKRDPQKLVIVALLILVMRYVDSMWMLVPAFNAEHDHFGLLDVVMSIVSALALGGLWLAMFIWQLNKRSLIPINDPQYESVLEQAHAGH
ncbi:MAG TPA: hypothetical protein VF074_08890 [Pyrinomonadaceae bacterium]